MKKHDWLWAFVYTYPVPCNEGIQDLKETKEWTKIIKKYLNQGHDVDSMQYTKTLDRETVKKSHIQVG